ncbi:MAG: glycoside hydrolase family 2 protein [Pirellulales bacterium]
MLAIDPRNEGRQQKWFDAPVSDTKPTKVPWVIQDAFPGYHGVAWYWREFDAPADPHAGGRSLLRFHAVDYLAEVWLNGTRVGGHEGSETPFVLDVTGCVKPGQKNLLAVRVLNPTYEPIDGIALAEIAKAAKHYPVGPNQTYNAGGIVGSVELLLVPAVRVEDLFVVPDWKTGDVRIQVNLRNAGAEAVRARLDFDIATAASGKAIVAATFDPQLPPGDTPMEAVLHVKNHRLWELDEPCLYRATARVQAAGSRSADERSVRCGFRDFRFENGYFRLNGKRIFLQGPMNHPQYPAGFIVPHDPDFPRRDVLMMKDLGFNFCRVAFTSMTPDQLALCDEIGLLVVQGHLGDWQLAESPQMEKRFDRSIGEMIRRDRNHPSVVCWDFLNEIHEGRLFRHAVDALSLVRSLDPTRMVLLNSGTWARDPSLGGASNPGSLTWDARVLDRHLYPPVPHTAEVINDLRGGPVVEPFIVTEYGQCSALNYPRLLRQLEEIGKGHGDDATYYRQVLEKFVADWKAWKLDECWDRPEAFFVESQTAMPKLRLYGGNAILSNPNLVGHAFWNSWSDLYHGSGVVTTFRELKPGMADVVRDLNAPLRFCLFVEPVNIYRGAKVRLEAVLANHDALKPGTYPVRFGVVGPDEKWIMDKTIDVAISEASDTADLPFNRRVFSEDIPIDGPSGKYRFVAAFERGATAAGGLAEFHVEDANDMPAVTAELLLWGDDRELEKWLAGRGIRTRPFAAGQRTGREGILATGKPPAPGGAAVFAELARHIGSGSTAVFLDPRLFAEEDHPTRWLPLKEKGTLRAINVVGGFYRADDWAKNHPIFAGLPCGGIMDYLFYREILPQTAFVDIELPSEAVCGGIRATGGNAADHYASGLHVSVHPLGAGRFILNNLKIRENLGKDPAAERLLRNMLIYASNPTDQAPKNLPSDSSRE